MRTLWLLPALLSTVCPGAIPGAMEVNRGTYVLVGLPSEATRAAMKAAGISCVICLCRESEPGFDLNAEALQLSDMGIGFARLVVDKAPTAADFELFRQLRAGLAKDARILVHCRDGNRAAAVTIAWLAMEGRVKRADALALARKAGMYRPETEKALAVYLGLAM